MNTLKVFIITCIVVLPSWLMALACPTQVYVCQSKIVINSTEQSLLKNVDIKELETLVAQVKVIENKIIQNPFDIDVWISYFSFYKKKFFKMVFS